MAALLHPDSLSTTLSASLFSLEPQAGPATAFGRSSAARAPWNDPSFLDEMLETAPIRRPQLRLITGGLEASHISADRSTAHRGDRSTVRRPLRTVFGGVALAMLVSLAAVGALNLLGADAAATVPASPAAINHPIGADATTTSSAPVEVVVQSGDTLWSIARRLRPTGEVRGVVDALQRRTGGAALEVGQHVDVRGLTAE